MMRPLYFLMSFFLVINIACQLPSTSQKIDTTTQVTTTKPKPQPPPGEKLAQTMDASVIGLPDVYSFDIFAISTWPKKGIATQSWAYMPLILTAMHSAGLNSATHLDPTKTDDTRTLWYKQIPNVFELFHNLIVYNLKAQNTKTFNDDTFNSGNGQQYTFDNQQHMAGPDQEKFLANYLNLAFEGTTLNCQDFTTKYPITDGKLLSFFNALCPKGADILGLSDVYFYVVFNSIIITVLNR